MSRIKRIVFCCCLCGIPMSAFSEDPSARDEYLRSTLTTWRDQGTAIFVAGCEAKSGRVLLVVPIAAEALIVWTASGHVEYTAAIAFSAHSEIPLIEGEIGGMASTKNAYEFYEKSLRGRPFSLVTSYDYDLLMRGLKFDSCVD